MTVYKKFGTDNQLESKSGVTIDYGDFKITLHRAGGANKEYYKVFQDKIKPYRRMIEAGNMDNATSTRLLAETYAKTVIKGWEGMTDEKGKKLPFTEENCIKVLTDLPDFFALIQEEAQRLSNFLKEETEADTKNSVKS